MSELLDVVLQRDDLALLDAPSRRLQLRELLLEHDSVEALPALVDHIDGFGPLSPLMRAPGITDVLVNGHDEVWVERDGELVRTDVVFEQPSDLLLLVERMLGRAGRRADRSHPIEDAHLPDGSRIHVVMPPLAGEQPVVSIRRFDAREWDLDELVRRDAMSVETAAELRATVQGRGTVLVAGRTGCGKTTLVNALLSGVPAGERVVTIEETRELVRAAGHHVALVTRPPNADGSGAVGPDELLRAALRMRPDRIVVGEVRGAEAGIAIEALSTGHRGGMLTVHADDAHGALERLARLCSGSDELSEARTRVRRAIDVVVVLARRGVRRYVAGMYRT